MTPKLTGLAVLLDALTWPMRELRRPAVPGQGRRWLAADGRLSYHGDRYYRVGTDPSWAGTCRQLAVTLNDGTTRVANIAFG